MIALKGLTHAQMSTLSRGSGRNARHGRFHPGDVHGVRYITGRRHGSVGDTAFLLAALPAGNIAWRGDRRHLRKHLLFRDHRHKLYQ